MPDRPLVRTFLTLYVTLGAVILVQADQTVLAAHRGGLVTHEQLHALIIGAVEAIAAILFLVPRTMRYGAVTLLAVFALAFGLHALAGEWHLTLLVYAAGVLFVRVHGVRGDRWNSGKATSC